MTDKLPPWALLAARWPEVFDLANVRPLKIGIHKDIMQAGVGQNLTRLTLCAYVATAEYRETLLQPGAVRIDLNGQPAGVVTERDVEHALTRKPPKTPKPVPPTLPLDLPLTGGNLVPGKLEVTIKFSELPQPLMIQSGVKFGVDCDGRRVSITVKPKAWKKLTNAAAEWPLWMAAVTGKMGPATKDGFELLEPGMQVFEKKAKVAEV